MDLISVVVPVYNVEKYLEKCIFSIINQTYTMLEILLIDDGSTDSSGKICDKFEHEDNRIKVFHKENGGLSSARNFGISKMSGKYVCFIDSDDYIDKNFIFELYSSIKKYNSDISTSAKVIENNGNYKYYNNKQDWCLSNIECLKKMFLFDDVDNSACDKLFKSNLFNDISFPENKYYEDIGTIFFVTLSAKTISHVSRTYYHYVYRSNSISKQVFSKKQFDMLDMIDLISTKFNNINELNDYFNTFYYTSIMSLVMNIYNSSNKNVFFSDYKRLKDILYKNRKKIFDNKVFPFYKKVMIFLIVHNFEWLVIKIKGVIKNEN